MAAPAETALTLTSAADETDADASAAAAAAALLDSVPATLREYDALAAAASPESEPYRSKYAARALLPLLVARAEQLLRPRPSALAPPLRRRLRDAQALGHSRLGVNLVQTEENQAGEAHLQHALVWLAFRFGVARERGPAAFPRAAAHADATALSSLMLDSDADSSTGGGGNVDAAAEGKRPDVAAPQLPQTSVPALSLSPRTPPQPPASPPPHGLPLSEAVALACGTLEACNYLALLLSGWDNHARALKVLRLAKTVYARLREQLDALGGELALAISGLARLDSLYTHSLFYFAQVYGHLHARDAAACYIEATLGRQLAEQEEAEADVAIADTDADAQALVGSGGDAGGSAMDRAEWARNVLRLGEYHCGRRAWRAAAVCYYAAEGMLAQLVHDGKKGFGAREEAEAAALTAAATAAGPADDLWALPEATQRLLAETATHWGLLYEALLRYARDRDFAREHGLAESAFHGHTAADDDDGSGGGGGDDGGADLFSTGAVVRFGRLRPGETAESSLRGEGADIVDLAASDHEGDVELLRQRQRRCMLRRRQLAAAGQEPVADSGTGAGDGAAARIDTAADPDSASAAFAKAPLAAYVAGSARRRRERQPFTSYGPARVGALSCPSRLFASGLATLTLPAAVKTYETARGLFRAAHAAFERALQFFVLDGFVSEHVGILTSVSRLYKCLAFYEPDRRRAAAMHMRRAESLSPLLRELNPSVFLQTHKELALEVAGAYQEVFELRLARTEDRLEATAVGASGVGGGAEAGRGAAGRGLKAAEVAAINEAADGALQAYAHFARCFAEPRLAKAAAAAAAAESEASAPSTASLPALAFSSAASPLSGAAALDSGSAEALMTAHFCAARILARRLAPSRDERLRDQRAALARYRFVLEAAPLVAPPGGGPGEGAGFFAGELQICRQVAELMPQKIRLVAEQGLDVLQPGGGGRRG